MEQQHHNNKKSTLKRNTHATSLKIIRGIRFTDREIDVLACLLSGRAYKKIASFLSISPKTVELHVRNIMLRLKCHSREGIIDFIEKSDEFTLVKTHYSNILIKIAFEQELKKLISITKETSTNCLIFYYGIQKAKTSFVYQLEGYLNIAGIKTVSRVWEKGKSESFLTNKIGTNQVNCVIYIISNEFVEQLALLEYEIEKEASNLIPIIKENPSPIIFFLLNDKKFLEIDKKLSSFSYISLVEQENYYLLVFELLKKLLPDNNIDTNIVGFKKQYEIFNSAILQKWQKDDGLVTDVVNIKDNNRTEKNLF